MSAFKELAQESTTLLLPGDTHNPASMVAQVRLTVSCTSAIFTIFHPSQVVLIHDLHLYFLRLFYLVDLRLIYFQTCLHSITLQFQAMTVYDRLQTSSSSRSPPAPTSSPGSSTPAPSSKLSPPVTPQTKPSSRLPDDVELLRDSPTSFKLPKQFVNVGQ